MFHALLRRLPALVLMPLAFVLSGVPAAVAEGGQPYADVSVATCVDEQGQVTVTLHPGAQATKEVQFIILVDNVSYGDDVVIPVAPGTEKPVVVSNLDDGTHRFEIIADEVTVFDQTRDVACDPIPDGPYTNPWGSVMDMCGGIVRVAASNMPIREQLQGLQPVKFTVTFVAHDSGTVQQLDSFTLPSGEDDAFDTVRTYRPGKSGVVSLYAEGMEPIHRQFIAECAVVSDSIGHHPHANSANPNVTTTLPNTGLSVRQWQAVFGFAMLLLGIVLVMTSRRPVRVRTKR